MGSQKRQRASPGIRVASLSQRTGRLIGLPFMESLPCGGDPPEGLRCRVLVSAFLLVFSEMILWHQLSYF